MDNRNYQLNAHDQEHEQEQERKNEQSPPPYGQPKPGFTPVGDGEKALERKHSGPGIASFVVFLAMMLAFVGLLVAFVAMIGSLLGTTDQIEDIQREVENAPELALVGLLLFGTVLGYVIGLVLGIIGLVQKERKKVFAILGTIFNGLTVGLFVLMILLAIIASATV